MGTRRVAARTAAGGALAAAVAVTVLHVVDRAHDPVTQRLSEYAGGPHGWLLTAAFVAAAVALLGLGALGWTSARQPVWQRAVAAIAGVGAMGMAASALYRIGVSAAEEPAHSVASTVAALAATVMAGVWPLAVPSASRAARWLGAAAVVLLVVSPVLHDTAVTGVGQRLLWLALLAWIIAVARPLR